MATENQAVRSRKNSGLFTILTYAACEWFLIFLLFMGAVFSYMLRKFALYCELEMPCPLCSMLDSVFWKRKPGSYWSLVCSFHKEEISSLVSCFTLGNPFDVCGMCEECLMGNSESHKLLVGKSWVDVERSVLHNPIMNKHFKLGSLESRTCLCCNRTRKAELNVGLGASKANATPPMHRVPSFRRLRRRGSWKGSRGKFTAPKRKRSNSVDTSSHLGYSKPKLSSDSESEMPLSEDDDDDDDESVVSSGNNYMKPEHAVEFSRRDLRANYVVIHELKNVCPSPLDEMNEHCLRELSSAESGNNLSITEKPVDYGGPRGNVAGTSSNDACSSNSNSKNLSDSFSQISDSAKFEQGMKRIVQASTSEVCSLLKRNDSSYESLDGISVDDIENESIVDRLKRQVEHDRICIKSLLNELEEERNAAAVAANETMAMITRLQDEKATLRMEALQYLRMVEETANDILLERERELEDMEYELEYYRSNEKTSVLEKEKLGISQCLKELEKKVDEMGNGLD